MTVLYQNVTTVAPVSMTPVSSGNVYGVNGLQRGFVLAGGTTGYPIGVTAAPAITAASSISPQFYFVASIEVTSGGENYTSAPLVSIPGVTGARVLLDGTAVGRITFTTSANTYTTAPAVTLTGGQASGATAEAILRGSVSAVAASGYSKFTSNPDVVFATATGVTTIRAAAGRAVRQFAKLTSTSGPVVSIIVTDQGQYLWNGASIGISAPVTAVLQIGTVTYNELVVTSTAAVSSVTVVGGGTGYSEPPSVSFFPASPLGKGGGAAALVGVTGGSVSDFSLITNGNGYDGGVRTVIESDKALATAVIAPRMAGKYLCGVRLIGRDGVPGNFGPLATVDCGERASSIVWTLSGVTLTDGTPNRISKMELWRTTGDQAITLYKVAEFTATRSSYTDSMPDADVANANRSGYAALRILNDEGHTNAYRFGVPPSTMSVVTMFQDRAWYAVDTSGAEPNTIYFSAVDEPESVANDAQVILQTDGRDGDAITGLIPLEGALYVGQSRNLVRLIVAGSPYDSASATPVAQRGLLNDRCWDRFEGACYIADASGLYSFNGSAVASLSDAVGNYWSEPLIDFSKSKWFFVHLNATERVVRFHFVAVGSNSTYPDSALCYSLTTSAWWLEQYGQEVAAKFSLPLGGRQLNHLGSSGGKLYRSGDGENDDGTVISYSLKTGNFPLNTDPKRAVRLTYTPTQNSMGVQLFYNDSATPRPMAAAVSRGDGFTSVAGATAATLNMAPSRSALGTATGFAQLMLSGRMDDHSAGGDRTVAIGMVGTAGSSSPVVHSVELEGAG
jgi:hypothetical protein